MTKDKNSELYVTVETGGSIGENATHGHYRIVGNQAFKDRAKALAQTKSYRGWSGGYYNYHYTTKTLAWTLRMNKKIDQTKIVIK